jgi:hypothetical protein
MSQMRFFQTEPGPTVESKVVTHLGIREEGAGSSTRSNQGEVGVKAPQSDLTRRSSGRRERKKKPGTAECQKRQGYRRATT